MASLGPHGRPRETAGAHCVAFAARPGPSRSLVEGQAVQQAAAGSSVLRWCPARSMISDVPFSPLGNSAGAVELPAAGGSRPPPFSLQGCGQRRCLMPLMPGGLWAGRAGLSCSRASCEQPPGATVAGPATAAGVRGAGAAPLEPGAWRVPGSRPRRSGGALSALAHRCGHNECVP